MSSVEPQSTRISDFGEDPKFLRSFRLSPDGPPRDAWPTPAILRRWMAQPSFRAALTQVRLACRDRAQVQLSFAPFRAAQVVQASFAADSSIQNQDSRTRHALSLLHLDHSRRRFSTPDVMPRD